MIISIPVYLFGISLLLLIFGAFSYDFTRWRCLISHPSSHLRDWLPIIFHFGKGFHRGDFCAAFCMFIHLHPPIAILHTTLWVVVEEA